MSSVDRDGVCVCVCWICFGCVRFPLLFHLFLSADSIVAVCARVLICAWGVVRSPSWERTWRKTFRQPNWWLSTKFSISLCLSVSHLNGMYLNQSDFCALPTKIRPTRMARPIEIGRSENSTLWANLSYRVWSKVRVSTRSLHAYTHDEPEHAARFPNENFFSINSMIFPKYQVCGLCTVAACTTSHEDGRFKRP